MKDPKELPEDWEAEHLASAAILIAAITVGLFFLTILLVIILFKSMLASPKPFVPPLWEIILLLITILIPIVSIQYFERMKKKITQARNQ